MGIIHLVLDILKYTLLFNTQTEYYPITVDVKISTTEDSEYKNIGSIDGYGDSNAIKITLSWDYTYNFRFTTANGQVVISETLVPPRCSQRTLVSLSYDSSSGLLK